MVDDPGHLGTTRSFETTQGHMTYPELSEQLAVALARILERILRTSAQDIVITPDWLCERHRDLAGDLFPDWAGRFRTTDVKVGTVETAPTDAEGRRAYLEALRAGDAGDLLPLQQQWIDRLAAAI